MWYILGVYLLKCHFLNIGFSSGPKESSGLSKVSKKAKRILSKRETGVARRENAENYCLYQMGQRHDEEIREHCR